MKKISCILALIMIVSCFAACAEKPEKPDDTSVPSVQTDEITVPETDNTHDEKGYLKDEMGDYDFGGKDFTVYSWSDGFFNEFVSEQLSGDTVDDANYKRICKVEDRCKIKFKYITAPSRWPDNKSFAEKLKNELIAGTQIDMAAGYTMAIGACALSGLCLDLTSCTKFEWEKPWWPESLMSQCKIKDKLYFVSGDVSPNTIVEMYAMFFNKKMINDRNLEDPYALVDADRWNLDTLMELCKNTYIDSNSDGTVGYGDTFGLSIGWELIDSYVNAAGITFLKSENGELTIHPDMFGERGINLIDKIVAMGKDTSAVYLDTTTSSEGEKCRADFCNGLVMFWDDAIADSGTIYDSSIEYGIVPVPKADANQADYCTPLDFGFAMYLIPYNVADKDYSATVMEILASEGYRTTTPAVFDIKLKYRYANDPKASEMFDIMREKITFDMVMVFSETFDHPYNTLRKAVSAGQSWKSTGNALSKTSKSTLEKKVLPAFD